MTPNGRRNIPLVIERTGRSHDVSPVDADAWFARMPTIAILCPPERDAAHGWLLWMIPLEVEDR